MKSGKWGIDAYDPFDGEDFSLPYEYYSEQEALEATRKMLADEEKLNPSETSGGQGFGGLQTRFYVRRPDGSRYQVL